MILARFTGFTALVALATSTLATPAFAAETPVAAASAPDPEALATAHKIVAAAFPPERRQAMMDKIMHAIINQMKAGMNIEQFTDPGFRKILEDYLENIPTLLRPTTEAYLPKEMDAVALAYTHMFTAAQLRDILAFAQTPSGTAYLSRASDLLSDPAVAAANVEYFKQSQSTLEAAQENLKTRLSDYVKAHPDMMKDTSDSAGK